MGNQIRLKTAKANIESLLQNQLNDNIFVKYLTPDARLFFTNNAELKQLRKGEYITPKEFHGSFVWVLSGQIYLIFSRGDVQKHFGTLGKANFFALRRDFEHLKLYIPEDVVTITMGQQDLVTLFKMAPPIQDLLKKTILDIHFKLEELNTYYN